MGEKSSGVDLSPQRLAREYDLYLLVIYSWTVNSLYTQTLVALNCSCTVIIGVLERQNILLFNEAKNFLTYFNFQRYVFFMCTFYPESDDLAFSEKKN